MAHNRPVIEMFARLGWIVPEGFVPDNAASCRRCARDVLWCRVDGRKVPLDRDGSPHPWECRVGIGQVRHRESGRAPLQRCMACSEEVYLNATDMKRHAERKHGA